MRVPALRAKSMNSDFAKTFLNNTRSGQRAPRSHRERMPGALKRLTYGFQRAFGCFKHHEKTI